MSARVRKFIGMFGILAFLAAYVVAAATISEQLPGSRPVQLIFFVVAGLAWGLPLFPLIRWMNSGR